MGKEAQEHSHSTWKQPQQHLQAAIRLSNARHPIRECLGRYQPNLSTTKNVVAAVITDVALLAAMAARHCRRMDATRFWKPCLTTLLSVGAVSDASRLGSTSSEVTFVERVVNSHCASYCILLNGPGSKIYTLSLSSRHYDDDLAGWIEKCKRWSRYSWNRRCLTVRTQSASPVSFPLLGWRATPIKCTEALSCGCFIFHKKNFRRTLSACTCMSSLNSAP